MSITIGAASAGTANNVFQSNPVLLILVWKSNTEFSNTQIHKGTRPVTFQLMSSMFGGSSDKYLPMSAINGMRIIFSLENLIGSCCKLGLSTVTP
jgi:hypothetical protein